MTTASLRRPLAGPLQDGRLRRFMQDRLAVAAVTIVSLILITWLDHVVAPDIGSAAFYVIPVALISWLSGRRLALLVTALAVLTWMVAELGPLSRFDAALYLWAGISHFFVLGTVAWLISSLREEREQLRAHLEIVARARAEHEALLASLREPLLIVSRGGEVTDSNAAAASLFGPLSEIIGRQLTEVVPFIPRLGGAERSGRWQGTINDVAGRAVEVEASVSPLVAASSQRWALYVLRDMGQHAEVLRLREQLLYDVAHELRAPLAVLDSALEILSEDYAELPAEEFGKLIGSARRTAARLHTIMDDLLSAGSIQAGRFKVKPAKSDLRTIVREALETVELAIAERHQTLEVDLGRDGFGVIADPRYVRQVLSNLLTNASKYGGEDSTVRVTARRSDGRVVVSVEDEGPGISPEQQAGLFERYYRVRGGNEEPGIGLGLAIAKGIVEAHGGRIGVESEPGKGTTVWFTLLSTEMRQ